MAFPEMYLERLVGLKVTHPRKHSPIWMQCCNSTFSANFNFDEIIIHGITVLVAEYINKDKIVVSKLVASYNDMKTYFDVPLLLLLPAIDSVGRRNLLNRRINFVVPGQQIYFPELYISLKESESIKHINPKQLSLPAQVLVLYHLQKRSLAETPLSEIAKLIGYSNKTISLVVPELQNLGIAKLVSRTNRTKTLSFYRSGIELWNQIEKYLQNPIAATGYTNKNIESLNPVKCVGATTYNSTPENQFIEYCITQNEARSNNVKLYVTERGRSVRLWRYNPRTLATDGCADILSTILSYPQHDRSWAASRLLPHVKWADVITSE